MSIPITEIVNLTPRVLAGGSSALPFNGLLLTTDPLLPVDTVKQFTNASEVATFFGYDSDAYKAALVYFNGYNNSLQKPSTLLFFRHMDQDAAAFVRGQPSEDEGKLLANLKSITNGEITVHLGPTAAELTGLSFSKCTSLSECAGVLQDALNTAGTKAQNTAQATAEVDYSSQTKAFTITSGQTGSTVAVDYAEGGLADVLGLSEATSATLSYGGSARSYSETLDKAVALRGTFVSFSTVEEVTNAADAQELAEWCNNKSTAGDQYLYAFFTTDVTLTGANVAQASAVGTARVGEARLVNAGGGADILANFAAKNYEGVVAVYGDVRYAAFIMGCAASIDWEQNNSTITLAFKRQNALEATVTDAQSARALEALKVNFVGDYASRNEQFIFFQHGVMFGSYSWIDTYLNSIWLMSSLQSAVANGFASVGRVPYTAEGKTLIFAWCQGIIQKALKNGVIQSGITLSDTQKQALTSEAGKDISSDLESNGYYLLIGETDANERQQRTSPPCNLWYTYGGSVHRLDLPVTAVV